MVNTMNNKWLKLILVASLAVNLAFISTAVYQKFNTDISQNKRIAPPPKAPPPNLKLSEEQRRDIWKIMKGFKMDMLQYKQDVLDKRIAIIEAMSDEEFNPEEIEKKTAELNELENKLNFIFVEALVQVNNILDSQQRLNFLLRMSKDWFFVPEQGSRWHSRGNRRNSGYSGGRHE